MQLRPGLMVWYNFFLGLIKKKLTIQGNKTIIYTLSHHLSSSGSGSYPLPQGISRESLDSKLLS